MRRVRWTSALAWFVTTAVSSWVASDLWLRANGTVVVLTPWGAVVALVISAVVVVCGLAVRRLRSRERTWITPTGAATTAAAAQACALVGAAVGGIYGGQLVLALLAPPSPAMDQLTWMASGSLVACCLWCATGFLVEYWCVISDDDDEDSQGGTAAGAAPRSSAPV